MTIALAPELTVLPTVVPSGTRPAGWDDVAAELAASCAARAPEGALLSAPGVVGVLSGAAPIVWAYGAADPAAVAAAVAVAPEVVEVHVRADDVATTRLLESTGWRTESVVTQLVHGGTPLAPAREDVMALTPADMADLRALLAAGGASEAMLAGCYGDDFFVRAAPVWVYGARDEAGRLTGCVAVRRQLRSAMVFALTVSPEARGSGLGRALVDRAVATARANGAEFCHAEAEPEALSLALSCGFAPVGAWRRLER